MHFGHNLGMLREERSPPVPKSTVNEIKAVDQGTYLPRDIAASTVLLRVTLPYHQLQRKLNLAAVMKASHERGEAAGDWGGQRMGMSGRQ
jgi:hypothetical protein